MKVFHWNTGRVSAATMTVAELRQELAKYPDDMPVFGEWEGVLGCIQAAAFSKEVAHKGDPREALECLLIDVENYWTYQ